MNNAKAIELAFAETVRQYAAIGADTIIRTWQSMRFDNKWDESKDRTFPVLDIRAIPATTDDNEVTLFCNVMFICATTVDDDKDHAAISAMYEEVRTLLDKIFSQFRQGDSTEVEFLNGKIDNYAGGKIETPVSFTWGDPLSPAEDEGLNMIGIGMTVHFGRSDFYSSDVLYSCAYAHSRIVV